MSWRARGPLKGQQQGCPGARAPWLRAAPSPPSPHPSTGGETETAPRLWPARLTVGPAHGVVQRAGHAPPRGAAGRVPGVHAPGVLIVAPVQLVLKEISLVTVGPGEGSVDAAWREAEVRDGPRESFLYVSVLKHPVSVSWGEKEPAGARPPVGGAPPAFAAPRHGPMRSSPPTVPSSPHQRLLSTYRGPDTCRAPDTWHLAPCLTPGTCA